MITEGSYWNNSSEKAGLSPVVFDYWLHRAKFTCRVCHVDIGFAMEASATKIKAETNIKGFHCGSCHNGKESMGQKGLRGVLIECNTWGGEYQVQQVPFRGEEDSKKV